MFEVGKRESFKVVIAGDSSVGKTSIVQRIDKGIFLESYSPTVGTNINAKAVEIDGKKVILLLTDVAGHQFFEKAIPAFFDRARTVLLVYDISNRKTFTNIKKWYDFALTSAKGAKIILVGNKLDLKDIREVPTEEGYQLAQELGIEFIEISAKTKENIDKVLDIIIKSVIN